MIGAALHALDLDPEILADADFGDVVRFDADQVTFVDAARRASRVAAMSPADRRGVHRALADATTEPRHRVQRAEHLASAAVGPDETAARALAELGRAASERGDTASSSEYFMRAAGLAPDPEARAGHLHQAADGYWNAGEYTAARAAFDAAYVGSKDPILRADIAFQLGQLDLYQRGPRFSCDLLVAASEAVEPHDVDRAAMLIVHAASTAMLSSDVVGALVLARRARELAASGDGSSAVPAALMIAFLSFHHGDVAEFDATFPALSKIADALKDIDAPEADLFVQLVGMMHVYTEQWDAGRLYLSAVAHRAGRRARLATVALARTTLAELCWRSGRWEEAWSLATSDVVREVTLTGARLWLLAFTAHLDAGFGRADDCRARAHAAIVEGESLGFGTAVMWANHALGLLELGLGHPVAAASYLDRIAAHAAAHEMVEPSGLWWQADHVEALVRSGRQHEATKALARFESGAARSGRAWALTTTARCRGLMAPTIEVAEACFEESLEQHDRIDAPFELARTLLCRAERRVSAVTDVNPSADLAEATAIFDGLGATSWSAQARALSDSITTGDEVRIEDVLSQAQLRVALAVAEGMSNKEVAVSLYVSEKTVEFHLHNVYRKLGVRSRTQLARRLPHLPT